MKQIRIATVGSMVAAAMIVACSGSDGGAGPKGDPGAPGAAGTAGTAGASGAAGAPGHDAPAADGVTSLELPGTDFYPQNLTSAADGTIFVGGLGEGLIAKFPADGGKAQVIVPKANPQILTVGLAVDDAASTLWACTVRFGAPGFQDPHAQLRAYDFNGQLKKGYDLPNQGSSMCEEVALGADKAVYVTDAFRGEIDRLETPGGALEVWAASALLKPTNPNALPFGAHGIAFDGAKSFYVANFNLGQIVRVPINADGTAGTASGVAVTPALTNPEGLRAVDGKTLVVTESGTDPKNGRLIQLTLTDADTATATTLRNHLNWPTSVTIAKGSYWIAEGQIDQFLAAASGMPSAPELPFRVERAVQE